MRIRIPPLVALKDLSNFKCFPVLKTVSSLLPPVQLQLAICQQSTAKSDKGTLDSNPKIINDDRNLALHSNRSWTFLLGLDLATPVVALVTGLLTYSNLYPNYKKIIVIK